MMVEVIVENQYGRNKVVLEDALTYSFKEEYLVIKGESYTRYIKKCLVIDLFAEESNIKRIKEDAHGI